MLILKNALYFSEIVMYLCPIILNQNKNEVKEKKSICQTKK